jgi:hypothetical protein
VLYFKETGLWFKLEMQTCRQVYRNQKNLKTSPPPPRFPFKEGKEAQRDARVQTSVVLNFHNFRASVKRILCIKQKEAK